MEEVLARFWHDIVDRVGGPLTFRLIGQPLVAATLGLWAGLRDAREGRPPYLWGVFTDPAGRRDALRDAWRDIATICVMASFLDGVYQYIVFRWFYPLETVFVALILAVVPYVAVRGCANRIARRVGGAKNRAPKRA